MQRTWGLALAAALLLAAPAAGSASEPKVVVTIKPLHALVAQVMAGVGTPELLVTGSSSPHTYALKPSQVRDLNDADVFVRMSEMVEPFTAKIAKALPSTVTVVTLQDAPGVKLLPRRTGATFEQHRHAIGAADHDHSHGQTVEFPDGHAWLDPDNAGAMVDRIAVVLAGRYPQYAAVLDGNAKHAKARLGVLAGDLGRNLEPIANRPYVVFHDAIQYLEHRYGLNVVGSIMASPDILPGGRRLTEVRQKVQSLDAVCVFAEPRIDRRLVENLIEGTSARTGTLDPEGVSLEPGPELYFMLMRKIAEDLRSCLAPPA